MKVITDYKMHSLGEKINEALSPADLKRLKSELKIHCDEVGSDFDEVCKLLKIQAGSLSKLDKKQVEWLNSVCSSGWEVNESTGKIDVEHYQTLIKSGNLINGEIPYDIEFGTIKGNFRTDGSALKIFRGFPEKIYGDLNISGNQIESLEGCTQEVMGSFNCSNNNLKSLVGGPTMVRDMYFCNSNKSLESLEGCPEKIGNRFEANDCSLTTLKGSPKEVGGDFYCNDNNLTTMKGAPERIDGYSIYCRENRLYSLEGLPLDFRGRVECSKNLFPEEVLRSVYANAKKYDSWTAAYLVLITTKRFQRMSKDQRDPIRDVLTGDALRSKSLELSSIWKDPIMEDPAIKRMIKRAQLGKDVVQDVELGADLKDIGF